jgi:hypothetical protein
VTKCENCFQELLHRLPDGDCIELLQRAHVCRVYHSRKCPH